MGLNLEKLLGPIDPNAPSGEDAEYDELYLQLEELAQGVPAKQMGESVVEGQDPDWSELKKSCELLFGKSHDLRVATYLTLAELCLNGLCGFRDGLQLIQQLLADEWDTVWPQLDPDDDNDPLERINILASLAPVPGAYQDPMMFIQHLRNVPLTASRQMGVFSLRDIMFANGELEATEGQAPEMSLINAAFADTPNDTRNENCQAVSDALDSIVTISEVLSEKVGVDRSISFASLINELKRIQKYYEQFGTQISDIDSSVSDTAAEVTDAADCEAQVAQPLLNINSLDITNRNDAISVLDKVCLYFEQTEPNSPIPYLLKRAARIAHMNFMDLIQELSPNAVEQTQEILGIHITNDDEND